ncbi:MAG: FecR domain-containing protein [Bdellovibrionaceae bacterium]|jgi:hypothetical protein|nr:FecR domain-containing protein [Pseudobdellovibrionaceae bacterium]
MQKVIFGFIFILVSYLSLDLVQASSSSCECPEIKCSPCESQKSLKFYSEKCGNGQVNSCAKPVCVALDPLPNQCLAKNKNKNIKRKLSSEPKVEDMKTQGMQIEVGIISGIKRGAWVESSQGTKKSLNHGMKIYESDTLVTDAKGQIKLSFHDKNELILQADSKIKLTEYRSPKKRNKMGRKALLDLLKGKVRNRVKKKYKGNKASFFKVRTKSAVAGVRGTDFVVSFAKNSKETTKIETLTGEVVLSDPKEVTKLHIKAGKFASYVTPSRDMFSADEIKDFVDKGYMTPVYKMSKKDIEQISFSTAFKKGSHREIASAKKVIKKDICESPSAQLNQCAWSCEGNPKGATSCRTDIKGVKCTRQRCNANGNWAEETRLPASYTEQCPAQGHKVGSCNY